MCDFSLYSLLLCVCVCVCEIYILYVWVCVYDWCRSNVDRLSFYENILWQAVWMLVADTFSMCSFALVLCFLLLFMHYNSVNKEFRQRSANTQTSHAHRDRERQKMKLKTHTLTHTYTHARPYICNVSLCCFFPWFFEITTITYAQHTHSSMCLCSCVCVCTPMCLCMKWKNGTDTTYTHTHAHIQFYYRSPYRKTQMTFRCVFICVYILRENYHRQTLTSHFLILALSLIQQTNSIETK